MIHIYLRSKQVQYY